ncbi:MAG: hypothetical protein WKF96_05550 [Solirubrobacteraceae bacterium]
MAFYQDPDKPRHRPSLIEDLFKLPTKPGLHPLENQSTATLAWLIDRSPAFAQGIVELFLGPGSAPQGTIGARTWVSLPNPGGTFVFPDLCIEAADGELQILVEVKVASALAQILGSDGVIRSQEAHYRWAWTALPGPHPQQRAVGTLTRTGGSTTIQPAGLESRDVTWSKVRDLICNLLIESAFEPETGLVADSFLRAINARIAVDPPSPAALAAWKQEHAQLVTEIAFDLRNRVPGATLTKARGASFIGHRVHIPDVLGSELRLRVYGSPAGAATNLVGEPDSLIVGIERDAQGTLEAPASDIFAEAGFLNEKEIAGFPMHRRTWPMEDALAAPAATATSIWEMLAVTGIGPWARRDLQQPEVL